MMNYENFKKIVVNKFKDYLPQMYQNMELYVEVVNKVNRKLDGIMLKSNTEKIKVFPTLYINDMYLNYLSNGNLEEVLQDAAKCMNRAFMEVSEVIDIDYDSVKDNIVFQLLNTLLNEEMLREIPHREFHDLSIIYRWIAKIDEFGIQSSIVYNNFAKELGMSEEQLFQYAVANTKRIFPCTIRSTNEVMRDISENYGIMKEFIEMPEDKMMWIISNERDFYGASSIIYEENLHNLAMKIGTDLYVLPSSIHECMVVSVDMGDAYELAEVVYDINMDQVALEERLSNQVYYYDKDARIFTLATDTPNKRIDGNG